MNIDKKIIIRLQAMLAEYEKVNGTVSANMSDAINAGCTAGCAGSCFHTCNGCCKEHPCRAMCAVTSFANRYS